MIDTRTSVAHEQLATASAHSAEILMDVSLRGRIGPISFPGRLNATVHVCGGGGGGGEGGGAKGYRGKREGGGGGVCFSVFFLF